MVAARHHRARHRSPRCSKCTADGGTEKWPEGHLLWTDPQQSAEQTGAGGDGERAGVGRPADQPAQRARTSAALVRMRCQSGGTPQDVAERGRSVRRPPARPRRSPRRQRRPVAPGGRPGPHPPTPPMAAAKPSEPPRFASEPVPLDMVGTYLGTPWTPPTESSPVGFDCDGAWRARGQSQFLARCGRATTVVTIEIASRWLASSSVCRNAK